LAPTVGHVSELRRALGVPPAGPTGW